VGHNIKAKNIYCLSNKFYSIGRAKASVFPDPVSANPIISLFFKVYGNVSF